MIGEVGEEEEIAFEREILDEMLEEMTTEEEEEEMSEEEMMTEEEMIQEEEFLHEEEEEEEEVLEAPSLPEEKMMAEEEMVAKEEVVAEEKMSHEETRETTEESVSYINKTGTTWKVFFLENCISFLPFELNNGKTVHFNSYQNLSYCNTSSDEGWDKIKRYMM